MEKRTSEALQDKIGEAVACRKIGECLCKLGEFDKALKFQNQYLALAQSCNDQVEIQRALATLGDTYYTQAYTLGAHSSRHLLDQAERKFLQALQVCSDLRGSTTLTESEYMAMRGRLLLNLGLVYDVRGAEKESTEYLQKALTIAKQWHLEEEQYLCHFNLATQALSHGEPTAALQSLKQALTCATRLHNKPRQSEVYCQLAIASVNAGDTKSSKHFLKKAFKLLPSTEESKKLIKLYRTVGNVEELNTQRSELDENDCEMFTIHEKLGDAFTDIGMHCGNYASAIHHYKLMVEYGERLGFSADKLIPAYVSLAQTYADNQQPDLAIDSYQKELELRGEDHEQISRTWLNIAEQEDKRGDGYKALSKTYMTAFTHAKKANHAKLQVQVLRSLIKTQEVFKEQRHKEQTEAKLHQVQDKYGVSGDDSEEEDSQPVDDPASDHDDDLSIADLTESDKSDEENVRPVLSQSVGTTRARRHKVFKKNEKGETPLHVACISGNLKRVKTLLAEGHPVNVRDHCGWTPLHEAANHDFPAVVEVLLSAGADINDRGGADCNGFTPLIDAASCGNLDIVQLLLERGANVLAKDDKGCTGFQALRNWYRDYADLSDQNAVAQYNAVVSLFQEKMCGDTRSKPDSTRRNTSCQNGSFHQPGTSKMTTGMPRPTSHSTAATSQHRSPSLHNSRSSATSAIRGHALLTDNASSEEEAEETVYHNPRLEDLGSSPQSATDDYRSSMLALGSSTQRAAVRASASALVSQSQRQTPRDSLRPALIDEQEVVGDNWLVEDVHIPRKKRKDHHSMPGMFSSDSLRLPRERKRARLMTKSRQNRTFSDDDSCDVTKSSDLLNDHRVSSPATVSDNNSVVSNGSSDEEDSLPVLSYRLKRTEDNVDLTHDTHIEVRNEEVSVQFGPQTGREVAEQNRTDISVPVVESQPLPDPTNRPLPDTTHLATAAASVLLARVRVKIEGSVFLIPIPAMEEKTVGWLSEEASQRYNSHFGRRPFLTLSSSDGAILSTDDVLSAVLSHDEQLEGSVHGWDQPGLGDRYAQACKILNTVKYRNICVILREAETSHQLSLSGLGLRSSVLLPVTRALRGHSTLTHLILADNQMGDGGLQSLVIAVQDLASLSHLSLAGNAITATGLKSLADCFPAGQGSAGHLAGPLQMLEMLDLSHNPLGNSITESLCRVVRNLPSLTTLSLSSCGFTASLFQHNRPALAAALQGSSIHQFDMSYNRLESLGVELLLRSVSAGKLRTLDLAHTCCEASPAHLSLHLNLFFSQGCFLQSLSLENCCLHREDAEFLCRLPRELPSLQKLNVSVNKAVTKDTVQRLVHNSLQCPDSQLHLLHCLACPILSPLSSSPATPFTLSSPSFVETVREKLYSPHPLTHLALSSGGLDKMDQDSLCDVWTQRWPQALVDRSAQSLILTLKSSSSFFP